MSANRVVPFGWCLLFPFYRAIANISAVVHLLPADFLNQSISILLCFSDVFTECRGTEHAPAIGDQFAGGISNNYKLVREAVDRGVPLHEIDPNANVVQDLKRIILPEESQLETGRKRGFLGMGKGLLKKAG